MPSVTDTPPSRPKQTPAETPSGWRSFKRGSLQWTLHPALPEDWLDEQGELPISRWLDDGIARVIKTGPHRTVYRLTFSIGNFFLKHYRTPDWQAVLQNLIRPCKADLEWRAARLVARLGLRTIETVAVGKQRRYGLVTDNFLVTREIPNVSPLDEFVLETFPQLEVIQQDGARKEIARQLGQITARLHQGGLLHRDLHPGNVLIQTDGELWQLYLIDLHALSRKRAITPRTIAYNFSLLNNFFARLSSRSDRMRFLKSYAEVCHRGGLASTRELVRYAEGICKSELSKADQRGDEKWQRGNRRLIILEDFPNHCRSVAELGQNTLRCFQNSPESLFAKPHLIAWQTHTTFLKRAAIELEIEGTPRRAIATSFRKPGLARNAWEMGHALIRRRMHAPRPLFFVETPRGEWDYLVIEELPDAAPLAERTAEKFRAIPKAEWDSWLNEVIRVMAVQLSVLYEHGFYQPNLRLDSLLIRDEARPVLFFASLETIRQVRRVDRSQVISALASLWRSLPGELWIAHSQALRFLRSYLGQRFSTEWKIYWRGCSSDIQRHFASEAA